MPVINSLAGFVLAASAGIGTVMGSLLAMAWVEHKLVQPGPPRREPQPVASEPSPAEPADRLLAVYDQQRAALQERAGSRCIPAVSALIMIAAMAFAVVSVSRRRLLRLPHPVGVRRAVPAGGPGAMRRPKGRFTTRGSPRSRTPGKRRS